jgi:hypothetical protein
MKILVIDLDQMRRESRTKQLASAGYEVDSRESHDSIECPSNPGTYDLMVCSFHQHPEESGTYVDGLRVSNPQQPILLLTDYGVFVPHGCLNESPHCGPLVREIAGVLTGSSEVEELGAVPQAFSVRLISE